MKTENINFLKELLRKEIIRNAKEQNQTDEQATEMLMSPISHIYSLTIFALVLTPLFLITFIIFLLRK